MAFPRGIDFQNIRSDAPASCMVHWLGHEISRTNTMHPSGPKQESTVRPVPEDQRAVARAMGMGKADGTGGRASRVDQGGEGGARPALDGEPGAVGRLSIAGNPPSPPTCRPPPIAEPSRRRANASRSL